MDCQSLVIVKEEAGKYLLLETTSKKLQLSTCMLKEGEDFQSAAQRCLNEVSSI